MRLSVFTSALVVSGLLASASVLSHAQQTNEDDSTVVYTAEYFEQWAPVTALDMLNRIPGVGSATGGNFASNNSGRGLGGGGGNQILIDGKRVAGKSNEANSQLQRIAADKVRHIELIRGTSADLDVRGDQVVNIVLTEALASRTYAYEVNTDRYMDGHVQPGGKFSVNGAQGSFNYLLSAELEPRHDFQPRRENSILADGSPNDRIREERTRDQYSKVVSANMSYVISDASSARLNLLFENHDNTVDLDRRITDLTIPSPVTRFEREETPTDNHNWEIGGDYEFRFQNDHLFKLLFIASEEVDNSERERFVLQPDGSEEKNLFVGSDSTEQEQIVRTSYSMGLFDGQDIEFGVERAQTTLDSSLRLGQSGSGPGSDEHGGLTPVNLSLADSVVEEIRYEPFLFHNWQLSPTLALESQFVYEASEITQTGDVYNKRDFSFIKPSFDLRWDVRPDVQLRATLAKRVLQLSFSDFVASSDTRDDDNNTMAGNANLSQEQVWRLNLGGEYRLPNDGGVIDGMVWYMRHLDVIERIDVTPPGSSNLQSANGNIGDGDMWGMELNGSVRMNMIDMPNLLLTSSLTVRDSEIEDPFTGEIRRFENFERGRLQLGFRHDLPSWRVNYGVNWNNRFEGNIKRYDVNNVESMYGDPNVTAFLEYVTPNDIRIRFDARSATNNDQCRIRERYDGRIDTGAITEIEDYCTVASRVVSIKINGTF